jgi:hypothetical protein
MAEQSLSDKANDIMALAASHEMGFVLLAPNGRGYRLRRVENDLIINGCIAFGLSTEQWTEIINETIALQIVQRGKPANLKTVFSCDCQQTTIKGHNGL